MYINVSVFDTVSGELTRGGQELLQNWDANPNAIIWMDLIKVDPGLESQLLEDYFQFHPLAIEDTLRKNHQPKLEVFSDHVFFILRGVIAGEEPLSFTYQQLAMFVAPRFIVTRHQGQMSSASAAQWGYLMSSRSALERGTSYIAIMLATIITEQYLPLVQELEERLEAIEDGMFVSPRDEHLNELLYYKRQLKKLRRSAAYQEYIFVRLREGGIPYFPRSLRHELNNAYENLERVGSLCTLYGDIANDLMNGYLSLSSHRLGSIMKILTIITAIFVPLTFLAGIYGMNFEYMPELSWKYAYFGVLGFMTAIALGLLWFFRRRKWL